LIKGMAAKGEGSSPRRSKRRRLGRGPGRERDMDVDSDEEESVEELAFIDIRARVLRAGFTEAQLNQTVVEYEDLDVWTRVANGTKLRFITSEE